MTDASGLLGPFLWGSAAAALVGLSKGGLPIVGMLSVPLLSNVMPPGQAAGLLLPIYLITDLVGLWFYRRDFDARNVAILIPAGLVGIVLGWGTASVVSEEAVGLLVGTVGICFVLSNWWRARRINEQAPAGIKRGVFWGILSGFTSFISHAGGPPYQAYVLPQNLRKIVYAGTTTIVFAAINLGKIVPYWLLGQLSTNNMRTAAWLIPLAMACTVVGFYIVKIVPERTFFILVQVALLLTSLNLFFRNGASLIF